MLDIVSSIFFFSKITKIVEFSSCVGEEESACQSFIDRLFDFFCKLFYFNKFCKFCVCFFLILLCLFYNLIGKQLPIMVCILNWFDSYSKIEILKNKNVCETWSFIYLFDLAFKIVLVHHYSLLLNVQKVVISLKKWRFLAVQKRLFFDFSFHL